MSTPENRLAKALRNLELVAKAHVGSYTRSDGTFVKEHDDGRVSAGNFSVRKNGSASLRGEHEDGHAEIEHRDGKFRTIVGNEVKGTHGDFDAAHAQAHKLGARFADAHIAKMKAHVAAAPKPAAGGYVAPKEGEVGHHEHQTYGKYFRKGDKVRDQSGKSHEVMEHRGAQVKTYSGESFHPSKLEHAEAGKPSKPAAKKRAPSKPLHHSDLREGDELEGPDGQKHEYLATHRGLGSMRIETRAGYMHSTEKDGTLPGWKKTGRNNA